MYVRSLSQSRKSYLKLPIVGISAGIGPGRGLNIVEVSGASYPAMLGLDFLFLLAVRTQYIRRTPVCRDVIPSDMEGSETIRNIFIYCHK